MLSRLKARITASNLFVLIAVIFGGFFIFATPLLWGADETSHTGRVYQLSHGEIFAREVHDNDSYSAYGFGGDFPESIKKIVNYVNYDFNANGHQDVPGIKWVDIPADYKKFSETALSGQTVDYNFSNTAIYSPLSYAPSVIGFLIARAFDLNFGPTLYLGRSFNLLVYIALFAFLLYSLRHFKVKWVFFVLALLPSSLYQASTVSADPITIALSFLIVGLIVKSFLTKKIGGLTRLDTIILALSAILLPITKPTYIFISFLTLIVPKQSISVPKKYARLFMPVVVGLGVLLYAVWQLKTGYLTNASKWIIAGVVPWWQTIDSAAQVSYVLHHPIEFIKTFLRTLLIGDNNYFNGLFGRLGFTNLQVPALSIVATISAFFLAVFTSETFQRTKRQLFIIAAVFFLSFGAIFGALYLTISDVGQLTIEGVQGRYFIPVLAVFTLFLLIAINLRFDIRSVKTYSSVKKAVVIFAVIGLLVTALKFLYVIWG